MVVHKSLIKSVILMHLELCGKTLHHLLQTSCQWQMYTKGAGSPWILQGAMEKGRIHHQSQQIYNWFCHDIDDSKGRNRETQ